ncbi:MAG: hypothetical protein ACYDG4_13435 [Desulfuromonadaceae bacterium]
MIVLLIPASEVYPGDLLECADGIWRPVSSVERVNGRLFFWLGSNRDTRSALLTDILMVGR